MGFVFEGGSVSLFEGEVVEGCGSLGDLDPGVSVGWEVEGCGLSGLEDGEPEADVLVDEEGVGVVGGLAGGVVLGRGDESEAGLGGGGEGFLLVARGEAAAVGVNPDLEEVDGVGVGGVALAVEDAASGGHALELAGSDDGGVAEVVSVLEFALEDVGDDLHVAVSVGVEASAGCDAVLVDDAEDGVPHVAGVVVSGEGEGVAGLEPVDGKAAALAGRSNADHGVASSGRGWSRLVRAGEWGVPGVVRGNRGTGPVFLDSGWIVSRVNSCFNREIGKMGVRFVSGWVGAGFGIWDDSCSSAVGVRGWGSSSFGGDWCRVFRSRVGFGCGVPGRTIWRAWTWRFRGVVWWF